MGLNLWQHLLSGSSSWPWLYIILTWEGLKLSMPRPHPRPMLLEPRHQYFIKLPGDSRMHLGLTTTVLGASVESALKSLEHLKRSAVLFFIDGTVPICSILQQEETNEWGGGYPLQMFVPGTECVSFLRVFSHYHHRWSSVEGCSVCVVNIHAQTYLPCVLLLPTYETPPMPILHSVSR